MKEVKAITVQHMIHNNLNSSFCEGNYHICLREDCEVVYYNLDSKIIYRKKDIKMPIWYKKDANPKYICYCNKVTEQQIIDAVQKDGGSNMIDIVRLTGAMKNGNCLMNHPFGTCCSPFIQEIINKSLAVE